MASLLSALASAVAPALAPLDWAEAALVSRGITTLKPRLAALFALVYTLPAWAAALATARLRRRLPPGKDRTAIEFVRLVNRAIASTTMYFVPAYICLKGLAVWSPWAGGVWNTPLSPTQLALLHMQSMYYVMDMPYTVAKGDTEQVVHHVIGLGLAIPSCLVGGCGLPMCATLFTEQGTSIWVRYTKLQRYFLPAYNPLERALVFANFAQNSVFFFAVNTPLMLRLAHETFFGTGIPAHGWAKWMLGSAFVLQLCYDAYWTTRLWSSYASYRKVLRSGGKSKAAKKAA